VKKLLMYESSGQSPRGDRIRCGAEGFCVYYETATSIVNVLGKCPRYSNVRPYFAGYDPLQDVLGRFLRADFSIDWSVALDPHSFSLT